MNEMDVKRQFAESLIVACLRKLVKLGKTKPEDVNHKWYVEFNEPKLQARGLAGAATLDLNNRVVLYLLPQLSIDGFMHVISHEVVHLVQICRGELIPMYGYQIWKGQEYQSLPSNSDDYFEAQPWEKEADELHPILLEHLKSKVHEQPQ